MATEPQLGVMLLDGAPGSGCRGDARGDAGRGLSMSRGGAHSSCRWAGDSMMVDVAGECGQSEETAVPECSTCA